MKKLTKVLVAAGGTAGHTLPALTVAEQLQAEDKSLKILFVTSAKKTDKKLIFDKGFHSRSILTGKLRRYLSFWTLLDPFLILMGFFQSLYIIIRFRPQVIFSKGGYIALPVVLAGFLLGRKIILHESDLEMGLANRISARFAKKVLIAYQEAEYPKINPRKIAYVGNPLKALQIFPKRIEGTTILIMGGSQGARNINQKLELILEDILPDFNVFHLSGEPDFEYFIKLKDSLGNKLSDKYKVFPSIFSENDFSRLLSEADIVISRAGASSLAELAYFAKVSIIVPLAGHQEVNSKYFSDREAVLVIKDQDLSADNLKNSLYSLKDDPEKRQRLSENIHKLSQPEATQRIINEIKLLED